MLRRTSTVVVSVTLMCSMSACTTTKLSSTKQAGEQLSRTVLEKRTTKTEYLLKQVDPYTVSASVHQCQADYVKTESKILLSESFATKNCTAKGIFLIGAYPLLTVFSFGTYPIIDVLSGFKETGKFFDDCPATYSTETNDAPGTMTKEFLDKSSEVCSTKPVTKGAVEVAYGEQSLHLKPSDQGVVRLPLRHIAHLENLDQKTTVVWQYEGTRVNTVSNASTPEQKQESVRNYLNKLSDQKLFTMQVNDRSGFYQGDTKLMEEIRKELPKYYHLEKVNLPPERAANKLAGKESNLVASAEERSVNRLAHAENAVPGSEADRSMNRLAKSENQSPEGEAAAGAPNRLARSENQLAGSAADGHTMNQLSKSENQLPGSAAEGRAANRLPDSENAVVQSPGDSSMDRLAQVENMVASTDEQFAYRLVPNQASMIFKSGEYIGNIELPVIDYNEAPRAVQVNTNVMARQVDSLLPNYQNEDRSMKVSIKDTSMTLMNKTDRTLKLNKVSMYYNGKFVDNILERPMELAPGSQQTLQLKEVIEHDLGLLANYGNINAQQAQRMKINFGLGASYLDPQNGQPATMSQVNTYDVFEMIRNLSETAKLEHHMLSLIDDKSIPPAELRQMFASSQDASDNYDPTSVQAGLDFEFDTGKADIKKEYLENLKKIGQSMQQFPKMLGIIEGHTDNVGSEELNRKLSEKRADAVKKYLVQAYGIDPSRIQAEGFGWSRPVADNATAEGRAKNRRIKGRIIYSD